MRLRGELLIFGRVYRGDFNPKKAHGYGIHGDRWMCSLKAGWLRVDSYRGVN